MKDMDITLLLRKAEELRALFVLGQRVIPFLEEIFLFVNDIKPLLDEINSSIQDNLKKMPNASKQLSKVTEATEMATTEIMDIVDGLVYKSDIISSNLSKIAEHTAGAKTNPLKIIEILNRAINSDADLQEVLPEIAAEIKQMKSNNESVVAEAVKSTDEILQTIKDDSSSIMMSLQVQDITSQQIAAVNHLLQTVQSKLALILQKFQNSDIDKLVSQSDKDNNHDPNTNVTDLHRKIAFDPDAVESITSKEVRQGEVDELLKSHFNGETIVVEDLAGEASQDDIDSLFAANTAVTPEPSTVAIPEPAPVPAPIVTAAVEVAPAAEDDDPFANFSQDDIDALFGN